MMESLLSESGCGHHSHSPGEWLTLQFISDWSYLIHFFWQRVVLDALSALGELSMLVSPVSASFSQKKEKLSTVLALPPLGHRGAVGKFIFCRKSISASSSCCVGAPGFEA